jgi:hypothetical protein
MEDGVNIGLGLSYIKRRTGKKYGQNLGTLIVMEKLSLCLIKQYAMKAYGGMDA